MRRYIPNYHWSMYSHFLSPKFQATRTQCNPSRSPLHSLVIPLLQSLVLSYLSISSLDHICDGVGTKLPNTVDFCIVWHSCYRCPNHSNIFPFTFSDAVSSSPHSFLTLAIVMCLDHFFCLRKFQDISNVSIVTGVQLILILLLSEKGPKFCSMHKAAQR